MAKKSSRNPRQPVATRNCRHFAGGELAAWARAGLEAIKPLHRSRIRLDSIAGCSVDLDASQRRLESEVNRWDYVIAERDTDAGIAVEPHPAYADQVNEMVRKKEWAAALLAREAPRLQVKAWIWLTGADAEPGFTPVGPALRVLAAAGITGPRRRLP